MITLGCDTESQGDQLSEQHDLLDIHFSEQLDFSDEDREEIDGTKVQASFPRSEDILEYSTALI